jgi:hypothetical protein
MQLTHAPFSHRPVQQSLSSAQPFPPSGMHAWQIPFKQRPEQQTASFWQGEPRGRQAVPGGPQTRPPPSASTQESEQQSALTVHDAPSGRHAA